MDPIGTMMAQVASHGLLGLVGVTLFERLVPIIPAHGLSVAIGIACAQGHWSMPEAVATTAMASLTGCILIYAVGTVVGGRRSLGGLRRLSMLLPVPAARLERLKAHCRAHEMAFAFSSQLLPVARELAPAVAGVLRAEPLAFVAGSAAGILLWNALFIGAGRIAAQWSGAGNVSWVAFGTLVALLLAEMAGFAAWRRLARPRHAAGHD